jgi:DHA1 family multidrug resistance protein-like MFS transporter
MFGVATNVIHPITTDYVRSLNLNDAYFGIFFSLMSIGLFIGSIIFGKLSNKIGKTYLLSIGLFGYAFFQFCFGYFNRISWLILLFRIGSGIMVAAPHTLFLSFVRDSESKENQGKAFSLMSSLYLLGSALGYKLGGFLYSEVSLDFIYVFLVQVSICVLLSIIFIPLFYKENKIKMELSKKYGSILNIKNLNGYLVIFLFSLLFITLGQTIVTKYIDVFVIDLNYDSNNLGDTILFSGIIGIVSNLVFINIINKVKKVNYELVYIILTFISVISLLVTFTIDQGNFIVMMYSTYVVYIICKSLMLPLEQTIISKLAVGNSGEVMGIRQSFVALGQVSGPLIASSMYGNNHYSVFYLSMIVYFIIGVILFISYKRKKEA